MAEDSHFQYKKGKTYNWHYNITCTSMRKKENEKQRNIFLQPLLVILVRN